MDNIIAQQFAIEKDINERKVSEISVLDNKKPEGKLLNEENKVSFGHQEFKNLSDKNDINTPKKNLLYDHNWQVSKIYKTEHSIRSLAQLKDESLICGTTDGILIWDLKNHGCRRLRGHCVRSTIQIDDSHIASCGSDTVKIWSLKQQQCTATFGNIASYRGSSSEINSIIQLNNGSIVCSTHPILKTIGSYGQHLGIFEGSVGSVGALYLSNGNIASGHHDGIIKIWNPETRECLLSYKAHSLDVSALIELKNGNVASCSSSDPIQTVTVWDIKNNKLVRSFEGDPRPRSWNSAFCIAELLDGNIAIGLQDKTIKICNPRSNTCIAILKDCPSTPMKLLSLSNGKIAAAFGQEIIIWENDFSKNNQSNNKLI